MKEGDILTPIVIICLLLFFIFFNKNFLSKIVWMYVLRISVTVMMLFLINVMVNKVGLTVPINVFTIAVIVVLKIPGAICIALLNFLKLF